MIEDSGKLSKVEEIVGSITKLPSLPKNIQKINNMIDSHHVTANEIGVEISEDPSLSASVLKLVNSGFYGFSNAVSSIPHAVVLLGLNVLRSVVSTAWATNIIAESFPGLHDHSLACSRTCYILSRNFGLENPEEMSAVGLLHDIGKVITAKYLPSDFAEITRIVDADKKSFCGAELAHHGITHADIGGWLLRKWNLPETTIEPILFHHSFDSSFEHAKRIAILVFADIIVKAEGFGWSGDNRMPILDDSLVDILGLSSGDLRSLMDEIVDQLTDVERYIGSVK